MKKVLLPLAGSLIVFSVPTSAAQVWNYPFRNLGQCSKLLQWVTNYDRRTGTGIPMVCQQGNDGLWYIVPA